MSSVNEYKPLKHLQVKTKKLFYDDCKIQSFENVFCKININDNVL